MGFILEMRNIVKRFPRVLANDRVNFRVREGEIHALVGENGAGKTTLMKILYGLYRPDSGEIIWKGKKVDIRTPLDAISLGIGMVHQHFMLIPPFTVLDNIILGKEPLGKGLFGEIDYKKARREIEELTQKHGFKLDLDAKVADIPVGMAQRVEIIKVLYRGAELLVLDEPTAVLTPQEAEELFDVLRSLRRNGKTIVFITHKLNEVMEISDRVTVMRGGKVTGEVLTSETSPREIARMMVGREVLLEIKKTPPKVGEVVLEVKDLWVKDARGVDAVRGISFSVREGEVLGIAGVAGNGQTELVEAITGLRKAEKGSILIEGRDISFFSPRQIRDEGVAHIPEDRLKRGLVGNFNLAENVILGRHYKEPFARKGLLKKNFIATYARERIKMYDVRPPDIRAFASHLSGGNQQKLILAREIVDEAKLIIASQPTRGLDIGAIEFVHKKILEERGKGKAVLFVSMELDEILSLSDRIIVMYEGISMGEFKPGELTREEIGLMMAGTPLERVKEGLA